MDDLSFPAVFKYKNFVLRLIGGGVVAFGFGWGISYALILDAIRRGTGLGYVVFFLLLSLLLTAIVCIGIAGTSDIVIDNQGISRQLFSKTWQTIEWNNVRLITAFPVSGGYGYSVRAFNIFPLM